MSLSATNPPDGAILDYYLPAASNTVTLEFLDAQGHLVRSFSNTDKPDITDEELQKQLIPLYWVRTPRQLSDRRRNAPLGLGPALSRTHVHAPRLSHLRDSARHASHPTRANGYAWNLYRSTHCRR